MNHENANAAGLKTGPKRRAFMAMPAGCTVGLMVPGLSHGGKDIAAATTSRYYRLGARLPLRRPGTSGAVVTNLGAGGDHVGRASESGVSCLDRPGT